MARAALRHMAFAMDSEASVPQAEPFDGDKLAAAERALRGLPVVDEAGRAYLEKHIPRLARTLALIPAPQGASRVLELGCYGQITPFLHSLCGYGEVRGAYFGELGVIDTKCILGVTFDVDHFNAERDRFPYEDGSFDLVVAGEIIEHLISDPMHMLLECRRVLQDGGKVLVTTPNVGSITSVAKTLGGKDNPQIYYLYQRPLAGSAPDIGHFREYTTHEVGETMRAAGFEVESLFTTHIEEYASHLPLLRLLSEHGFSTEHRGEQTWCVATKRERLEVTRYPWFLYEG